MLPRRKYHRNGILIIFSTIAFAGIASKIVSAAILPPGDLEFEEKDLPSSRSTHGEFRIGTDTVRVAVDAADDADLDSPAGFGDAQSEVSTSQKKDNFGEQRRPFLSRRDDIIPPGDSKGSLHNPRSMSHEHRSDSNSPNSDPPSGSDVALPDSTKSSSIEGTFSRFFKWLGFGSASEEETESPRKGKDQPAFDSSSGISPSLSSPTGRGNKMESSGEPRSARERINDVIETAPDAQDLDDEGPGEDMTQYSKKTDHDSTEGNTEIVPGKHAEQPPHEERTKPSSFSSKSLSEEDVRGMVGVLHKLFETLDSQHTTSSRASDHEEADIQNHHGSSESSSDFELPQAAKQLLPYSSSSTKWDVSDHSDSSSHAWQDSNRPRTHRQMQSTSGLSSTDPANGNESRRGVDKEATSTRRFVGSLMAWLEGLA